MKTFMQWLTESTMMPVYHGGSWDGISSIKVQGKGSLGSGAYFSPYQEIAARYAKEAGLNYITEANLNLSKPLVINTTATKHPCVEALIQLGMTPDKANNLVEKVEEEKGYMGKEISSRAIKQGYDGLMQYRDGKLMEIVIWNQSQVLNARKIPLNPLSEMSAYTPATRNGWTKDKIIKYLKKLPSGKDFFRVLNSYQDFDEFKKNLYYHGSTAFIDGGLKPSIVFSKKWDADIDGGGGYGVRYWSVSLSKRKKVASNFSGNKDGLSIYPVLIRPNANIVEMDLSDSDELDEHIEELWNRGIDAVYIGGGEEELSVINPSCCAIGQGEYKKVFGMNIAEPSDEDLKVIWDNRQKNLDDQIAQRNVRLDTRKLEKAKAEEEYRTLVGNFLKELEDYKSELSGTYKVIEAYKNMYSVGIKAIKHVELLQYKNALLASAKDDWARMEFRNRLG